MKRFIAILCLSLYLTTSTELHELFKLPLLAFHFQEHQSKNKQLTLLSFLQQHYSGETSHDNDRQHDSKLPFKTCQNDLSHVQWIEAPTISFKPTYFPCWQKDNCYATQTIVYASNHLNAIWHPPKHGA